MRKPTKLGYCTTCNKKVMVFDTEGKPFKLKSNYCEVTFKLSNDSVGKLAFCKGCVENGINAEEALLNGHDGIEESLKEKPWAQEIKAFHLNHYKDLKARSVVAVTRWDQEKQVFKNHQDYKVQKLQKNAKQKNKKYSPQELMNIMKKLGEFHASSN